VCLCLSTLSSRRTPGATPATAPMRTNESGFRRDDTTMFEMIETRNASPGPLGIVAGSGALPRRLIESCRAAGREVFVLALEGEADRATVERVPHAWCRLGGAATGLDVLRAHGVDELVLAGGVRRPSLAALRPDWRAAKFFARVGYRALGDDG